MSQRLDRPWLYEGRMATARLYVSVVNDPLRAYAAPFVPLFVANEGYDARGRCAMVTNHRCGAARTTQLLWSPLPEARGPLGYPLRSYNTSNTRFVARAFPPVLWDNLLRTTRTILVRAENRSAASNRRCLGPGVACATLFGIDFFVHDNFDVTVLDPNSLPSLPGWGDVHRLAAVVWEHAKLLGAATGDRTPYLRDFGAAVRRVCAASGCSAQLARELLALADERWGLGVQGLVPLFPGAVPDAEAEDHFSAEAVRDLRLTERFLREMAARDHK